MALKVEHDDYPSSLASTSSLTLEDPLSRSSPSKVKPPEVVSDHVNGNPPKPRAVRPSPKSPDDVEMDNHDQAPRKAGRSGSLTIKSEPRTSTSASASPKPESNTPSTSTKPLKKGPQLIGDLPITIEEAMKTFVAIQENHYQYSTLGRSREALESMTCECPQNGLRTSSFTFLFLRWGVVWR